MLFFTGRAFIVIRHTLKLVLEFQFDLQNPLKQPIMWIFEKWKIIVFGQNYDIFWPKGGLKPCIIMFLGNIHNMFLVPVTFGNFFFLNKMGPELHIPLDFSDLFQKKKHHCTFFEHKVSSHVMKTFWLKFPAQRIAFHRINVICCQLFINCKTTFV